MHRYATGWEFAASTDAYLIRTFDLFAASAAKGQDVQLMTSGMAAIVDEMHGRALSEESRRRREAEQGSSKRFQVLSVPYYFTKPRVVDGRYTRSEKITTTSGNARGFDTAQAASDHVYTLATKIGNHDISIHVDGREISRSALKRMARAEHNARSTRS